MLLGSALGVASLAVLPRFSTPSKKQDPLKCFTPDLSETEKKLVVSNWPAYIDEDADGAPSTMTQFIKSSGIDVTYVADVNDNQEFFAKVAEPVGLMPANEARHVHADGLDGRPHDQHGLDSAAQQGEHP